MRDFHFSINGSHLINCLNLRRKPSMNTHNLILNQSSQRQVVKGFVKILPWSWTSILFHNFVIETVYSSNLPRLMISPEQNDVFGVFELVTEKEFNGLNRVVPTVYKVSDKNVSWAWEFASYFKELQDIIKLPMNVTADNHRGFGLMYIRLLKEQLFDLITEGPYTSLVETLALFERCYPFINLSHMYLNLCLYFSNLNWLSLKWHLL